MGVWGARGYMVIAVLFSISRIGELLVYLVLLGFCGAFVAIAVLAVLQKATRL